MPLFRCAASAVFASSSCQKFRLPTAGKCCRFLCQPENQAWAFVPSAAQCFLSYIARRPSSVLFSALESRFYLSWEKAAFFFTIFSPCVAQKNRPARKQVCFLPFPANKTEQDKRLVLPLKDSGQNQVHMADDENRHREIHQKAADDRHGEKCLW